MDIHERWFGCLLVWVLIGGCAVTSPEIVGVAPAGPDALECARSALSERGYELSATQQGMLEAEVRQVYIPSPTIRELIGVSVSDAESEAPTLRVSVRTFHYVPAEHGLPVNRQSIVEVTPSKAAAAHGSYVLDVCGTGGMAGILSP